MLLVLFLSVVTLSAFMIGRACCLPIKSRIAVALSPVVGLSVVVLICSSCLLLRVPAVISGDILLCVLVVATLVVLRENVGASILRNLSPFFLAVGLLVLPYILRFGGNDMVTGYHTSNDSVIHALLSRGIERNAPIADKLFPLGNQFFYPLGAHSVIYLGQSLFNLDTRQSIFAFGLLYLAFSVFPLGVLLLDLRGQKLPGFVVDCCAALGVATYYNCAVGYHGFLPQVSYIPFGLACLVLLARGGDDDKEDWRARTIVAALCGAAALSVYSYAGMIVIGIGVLVVPSGIGFARHIRILTAFGVVALCALGANLLHLGSILRGLLIPFFGSGQASDLVNQSASFGNLLGFLDPRMWTGIWWEVDYRFQNLQSVSSHIYGIFATIGFGLAACALRGNAFGSCIGRRLVSTGILAYLFVVLTTHSPYPAGKIASFLAPVITTLVLRGALVLSMSHFFKIPLLAVLGTLMTTSNVKMMRHIAVLPGSVIDSMRQLAADYSGKRLLVFSGNDWLLYTLDRQDVDILGLHYLPDVTPEVSALNDYAAVIFEGSDQRKKNYACVREVNYSSFSVCELR